MFEAKRKGHMKEIKRDRASVISLIKELPEAGDEKEA
jgi:hypothetical protein